MTAAQLIKPLLVTDRLELWQPTADDLHPLFAIMSEATTGRFLGDCARMDDHFMRFTRNAGSWHLFGYGMLLLRERGGDGALLGNCGIFHSWRGLGSDFDDRPEAGWILRESAIGQGFATEAMTAILGWFDKEFGKEIVCMVAPENAPSLRLADMFGFTALRDAELPDGNAIRLFRRAPPSG